MNLSQIELVWVRVRVESECFRVILREENKVSVSKMAVAEWNWQNSRWLPSSSWVRMNEWSFFVQMVGTNLGRCEWVWEEKLGWLSLSQIELVWVRLRVEWECFWVNLREENKLSLYKMAVSESNMTEFKMAAIIKLSKKEWIWVRLN